MLTLYIPHSLPRLTRLFSVDYREGGDWTEGALRTGRQAGRHLSITGAVSGDVGAGQNEICSMWAVRVQS